MRSLFVSCNFKTLAKWLNASYIVKTCAQSQVCAVVEAFRMNKSGYRFN